jgi:hypothetical protein
LGGRKGTQGLSGEPGMLQKVRLVPATGLEPVTP